MTKVRRIWTRAIDHVRRYPAISLLIIFTPLIAFHALGVAFDPNRAYVFNEYVSKFVPFMSNARLIDLFDGWAMGDPRPRLMNALATKANLSIREWVDARWILPPALGISWLIYCLVPVFVFLGARRLAGSNYVALAAALVWSTSPPALDSLALCYVPAKPLMQLWFAIAFWLLASVGENAETRFSRTRRPLLLAATLAAAWLTDETTAIAIGCLGVIFLPLFLSRQHLGRAFTHAWLPVIVSIAIFGGAAFIIYPWINHLADQVPLEFLQTVIHGAPAAYPGAYESMATVDLGNVWSRINPLGLAFTLFSAYLIPNREVLGFWTWSTGRGPSEWPVAEALAVAFAVAVLLVGCLALKKSQRALATRVVGSLVVFVLLQSILLLPLAPSLLEVNYYAGLFALPFALFVGLSAHGFTRTSVGRWISPVLILTVCALQAAGYNSTSERNRRHHSNYELFWNQQPEQKWDYGTLATIRDNVRQGDFDSVAEARPYPSRAFSYAYELETFRRKSLDQAIDYRPFSQSPNLYSFIIAGEKALLARNGLPVTAPENLTLKEVLDRGATVISAETTDTLIAGSVWRCSYPDSTSYITISHGKFYERMQLGVVMRVWHRNGTIRSLANGTISLAEEAKAERIITVAALEAKYHAFENQSLLFTFTLIDR
jgi:hypothetical protein